VTGGFLNFIYPAVTKKKKAPKTTTQKTTNSSFDNFVSLVITINIHII